MLKTRWPIIAPLACLTFVAFTGCFKSAEPPPAGPGTAAPKSNLPDLPPDPRAMRRPAGGGSSAPVGAVGVTPLPAKPVAGSALNAFFPGDADGYDRVFTQEKNGFAMANLNKGGKTVASLSINDCAGNPSAREKFKSATRTIAGYPASSEAGTSILVGDRYQVKIRTVGGALGPAELEAWLQKFNLAGLAALK